LVGGPLLAKYKRLPTLLEAVYPKHVWQAWQFELQLPAEWWQNPKNVYHFVEWLGAQLGIKSIDDWYKVSKRDIAKHKGTVIISLF